MSTDAQRYAKMVDSIKVQQGKTVESHFAIAAISAEATKLVSIRALCRDTGMNKSTVEYHLHAYRYWGSERIPGCRWFTYYVKAAEIGDPLLRQGLLRDGLDEHLDAFPRHRKGGTTLQDRVTKHLTSAEVALQVTGDRLTAKGTAQLIADLDRIHALILVRSAPARARRSAA